MDLKIQSRPLAMPLKFYLPCSRTGGLRFNETRLNNLVFLQHSHYSRNKRRKPVFRASASVNPDGSRGGSAWTRFSRSLRRYSDFFLENFGESLKKETGIDLEDANAKLSGFLNGTQESFLKAQTQFLTWNKWEHWKDVKNWEPTRVAALAVYVLVVVFSCQRTYMRLRAPFLDRQRKQVAEAYMEALIPDPSPANISKYKKGMWRKSMPKGLKMKKFIEGHDGTLIHDASYAGDDAWDDDTTPSQEKVNEIIDNDMRLNTEDRKELPDGNQENKGTWRERLQIWKEVLRKEQLAELLESSRAKYAIEFDMKEVENSFREDAGEKVKGTEGVRALWISKRWWHYRPKLPYIYFLEKLDCSEVAAVVFTEDLKRLYVTMEEGFPLEYVVDIPLDPYLFEAIASSGAEVDLLQKRQSYYLLKVVIALLPGLLMLYFIKESLMLLHMASKRFLYRKYNRLFDMVYAENVVLPSGDVNESKSKYKDVVLGADVWDLLDELMIYMRNPVQYYEKEVKFVRGVILSGPPGTGKTLFARALARESGIPFIFASGAEFTDSERSGPARINKMFSTARENAPAFVFVDEIDAIAGRHAKKDPRRRLTFEALIAQLDGEKEKTGIDRFSLKQAIIFICATNRPDELDSEFVRAARIGRRLYIGLPTAKQRVQIFGVHTTGKQLAEDVDFEKLVFRTVGYSGADIRNLVNEAGIMAVRKGHSKIHQQDIVDVLDKLLLEGMGVLLTEEERQKCEESVSIEKKRLLAVHEAGHILLAHLFPQFDWHAFSQLLPGGKETAMSVFYPREYMVDRGYTTFGYLMMQMVVAHGGRCAERVVFGDDVTDGGIDDLEKITKIAREMVISPRNSRLGFATLTHSFRVANRPDDSEDKLIKYKWDDPRVVPADMTLELSELFTRELTRYIEETEELAMKGLMANKHILDLIANELLQNSRITGLEVEEILRGLSPQMFEDFGKPFQINLEEEGPLPHNDRLRYKPLDIYPAPLHRC